MSRDVESGHGNGKRTGRDCDGVRSSGRRHGTRARIAVEGTRGMEVPRVFSTEGSSPFDQVDWELRTAEIKDERGRVDLPADRLRDPADLEPTGHQRRRRASTSTATWPAATAARRRGSASIRSAS